MTVPTPIDRIHRLYEKHRLRPDFADDLWDHLRTGVVISRPRAFVMAKAVMLDGGQMAWFVAAAAGELRHLIALFPYLLPYIAFRRRGQTRVRVYDLDRFLYRAQFISLDTQLL